MDYQKTFPPLERENYTMATQGKIRIFKREGKKRTTYAYSIEAGLDPITGKRKRISKSGFKTAKEARQAAQPILNKLLLGQNIIESNITFSEYIDKWFSTHTAHLKPISIETISNRLRFAKKFFGNIKLKDITPFYWQKFLLFLAQTQPQKSIINNSFYPKHILKTAYKLKLISTNPTKDIALPKSSIKKIVSTEDLYFNQEELSHILKIVKSYKSSPYMYYICFLMSYTGMRLGELSALRWSDIDYKNKTIIINSTMYSKNKNIWLRQDTPKTLSSIRTISIGDDTISVLKEWHVYQLSNRLLNKTMNNYPKDDFVFTKYYAKENKELPILPTSIKSTFTRMRIKFNIPKLHSHIFRHTHVSLLSEAGISLEIIQNRLRHKDNNTTQKIYLHITKKSKINAAITFEKYMSKNGNKMATN